MNKDNWLKKAGRSLSASVSWIFENLSPLGLINVLVPKKGYQKQGGLNYGELERQKLDVYAPEGEARYLPVAVFFYGGS